MATDTADVGAGGRHGCAHNGVMRAVLQRARSASVTVEGEVVGELSGPGLVVLLAVSTEDTEAQAVQLAQKVWNLRMLEDEQSCASAAAPLLVVSQFTLYGDVRKGRRPSWTRSARGDQAEPLYERFMAELRAQGAPVESGRFGAMMEVSLVNSGPFTLLVDTDDLPPVR